MKKWIFLGVVILALVASVLPAFFTFGIGGASIELYLLVSVMVILPLVSIIFSKNVLKNFWLRWVLLVLNASGVVVGGLFVYALFFVRFGA